MGVSIWHGRDIICGGRCGYVSCTADPAFAPSHPSVAYALGPLTVRRERLAFRLGSRWHAGTRADLAVVQIAVLADAGARAHDRILYGAVLADARSRAEDDGVVDLRLRADRRARADSRALELHLLSEACRRCVRRNDGRAHARVGCGCACAATRTA